MSPWERTRTVFVALCVLVGATLVAGGLLLAADAVRTKQYHGVTRSPTGANVSSVSVYDFSELSPEGKRAFRGALDADDGEYAVLAGRSAPEFRYTDDHVSYQYVVYEGRYYEVRTSREDQLVPTWLVAGPMLFLGAAFLWGGRRLRKNRR